MKIVDLKQNEMISVNGGSSQLKNQKVKLSDVIGKNFLKNYKKLKSVKLKETQVEVFYNKLKQRGGYRIDPPRKKYKI